jgi:hypothetical protein
VFQRGQDGEMPFSLCLTEVLNCDARSQEKMQDTGRGPENGGKNTENFEAKEKRGMTDFPKQE